MSQISKISSGIFGGMSAAIALGAIQLAFGSDLRGPMGDIGSAQANAAVQVTTVNRAAKADRASLAPAASEPGRVLSFRVHSLEDTSVLMRLPAASIRVEAFKTIAAPSASKPASRTSTVACEPPVSVLTEVAKLLQPGRCVT